MRFFAQCKKTKDEEDEGGASRAIKEDNTDDDIDLVDLLRSSDEDDE